MGLGTGKADGMIRVLIADDSATERMYLEHIVGSDPDLEVAGMARDGDQAVEMAKSLCPDVMLIDIQMPGMGGYAATRKIMETCPVPIIVVSARIDPERMGKSFDALQAGAVAALEKPTGPGAPGSAEMARKIVQTVKLMAKIKNTHRLRSGPSRRIGDRKEGSADAAARRGKRRVELVVAGASTGGPPVLNTILTNIGPRFSAPILVVQHISKGFLESMVHWIGKNCPMNVKIAQDREAISSGTVYFAPDDCHMEVTSSKRIRLSDGPMEHGVRPSVSVLFRSALSAGFGADCIGVLLTGMGKDGAAELKQMRDAGSTTLVQNKKTCVVFGMPGEAARIEAASHILSPEEIADFLRRSETRK